MYIQLSQLLSPSSRMENQGEAGGQISERASKMAAGCKRSCGSCSGSVRGAGHAPWR